MRHRGGLETDLSSRKYLRQLPVFLFEVVDHRHTGLVILSGDVVVVPRGRAGLVAPMQSVKLTVGLSPSIGPQQNGAGLGCGGNTHPQRPQN